MELTCVTVDCVDPAGLATFWNEALEPELARLLALGAMVAWEESFPPEVAERYRNLVLRDPEGNEFCLGGGQY